MLIELSHEPVAIRSLRRGARAATALVWAVNEKWSLIVAEERSRRRFFLRMRWPIRASLVVSSVGGLNVSLSWLKVRLVWVRRRALSALARSSALELALLISEASSFRILSRKVKLKFGENRNMHAFGKNEGALLKINLKITGI